MYSGFQLLEWQITKLGYYFGNRRTILNNVSDGVLDQNNSLNKLVELFQFLYDGSVVQIVSVPRVIQPQQMGDDQVPITAFIRHLHKKVLIHTVVHRVQVHHLK